MALYKRGSIWWISIYKSGRHIQKSTKLKDKRMARAVEQALRLAGEAIDGSGRRLLCGVDKDEGKRRRLIRGLLTAVYGEDGDGARLDAVWTEYETCIKARGVRIGEKTFNAKKGDFGRFVKWALERGVRTIDCVTANLAMSYSQELAKRVSDKRRSNVIQGLSSIWNVMMSYHPGIANPWPQAAPVIDARKTTRIAFSREAEAAVMEAAKCVHPQWYVACLVGRYTGLRYGDVCRLTWGGVDLSNGIVCVTPRKTEHSSGVVVRIPMSAVLRDELTSWREKFPRATPFDRVLPWLEERSTHGDKRFRAVLDRAGLDASLYSFHTWRHTLASRMGEARVPLDVRKKILGHTTDEMAERYNHADLTEAIRKGIEVSSR